MPPSVKIAIIGGTGLDDPDILEERSEQQVTTPFGDPSDSLIHGKIKGIDCVLLSRHGRKHSINPSSINYRANIWALKEAGCTHVLATTACGSLQENIHPGDFVILDQFIDRTAGRKQTFYDGTCPSLTGVCHLPMVTPFCPSTRQILIDTAKAMGVPHHTLGTAITIEGPRFSSRAESHVWRSWGASIINMTTVPEVVLAKEAGLCYASVAMVTDYDCWRVDVEPDTHVSVEGVMQIFAANVGKVKGLLLGAVPRIANQDWTTILDENKKLVKASTL